MDSKTGVNLIQWPIEEVESLRGHKVSQTDVKLDAGAVVEVQGAKGDQVSTKVQIEIIITSHLNGRLHCRPGIVIILAADDLVRLASNFVNSWTIDGI